MQERERKKMRKILILSLMFTLFAVPAIAQDVEKYIERFELYNQCQPINFLVEELPKRGDAKRIGLTKEAIINSVESRLRSARIYDKNAHDYLYISVNIVGNVFSVETEFKKMVISYGVTLPATTWSAEGLGHHGNAAGYILSQISRYLDKFIAGYLRANEKDCK